MSRSRIGYIALSAVIASLVGYTVTNELSHPAPRSYSVTSVTVPVLTPAGSDSSYYTGTLAVLDGQVLVGDTNEQFVSHASRRISTEVEVCRIAVIEAERLKLLSSRATPCDDPSVAGQRVVPIESVEKGGNAGNVRISVLRTSHGSGTFRVGPLVMRYGNYSDTRPEWTYGGGYLWIFDAETPSGTEVLRISESTGAVLSTVHLPWSARVLLAADDDGLWIAQSSEGGWQKGEQLPLIEFVGVHARAATAALRSPEPTTGGRVDWLVASGHRAIAAIDQSDNPRDTKIELFKSPSSHRQSLSTDNAWEPVSNGEAPFDAPAVLEASGIGLLAARPGWDGQFSETQTSEAIIEINPLTGRDALLVSVSGLRAASFSAYLFYDDALYLLAHANGTRTATLYRIPM